MGTSQSTTSKTLATSCDSTNDGDCSIGQIPNIVKNKDIFVLEGIRHLHRQSTDSLCASIGSAEEEIDDDRDGEWNERLLILEDAANLARLADFYLNPQKQLVPSDPYAYGRNFFTSPYAYTPHTMEGDEEEEDEIQCVVHSREEERVFETGMPGAENRDSTTPLESKSKWQKTDTRVSLDPSCVVRFGLQYDNHQ